MGLKGGEEKQGNGTITLDTVTSVDRGDPRQRIASQEQQ